jgi:Kef-type K+ transport system membrane component KefB
VTGRGLRGRQIARRLLGVAVVMDLLVVVLFLVQPDTMHPLDSEPPSSLVWLIPAIGIVMNLAGLGAMIRIDRADPESHRGWWRFQGR